MSNFFHNHCNIISGIYKGWASGRGGVGVEEGRAVGVRLKPLLGLFGLAMSPRSASHRPTTHNQRA